MILFNYCTFGYSFATFTQNEWEEYANKLTKLYKWEQEKAKSSGVESELSDWNALLLVGLECVWYNVLTKYYNYSDIDALNFVCGPAYTPWWGMCNVYGIGNPVSIYYIERQKKLAKYLYKKLKSNNINPILCGWNGMCPTDLSTHYSGEYAIETTSCGTWCGLDRPNMIKTDGTDSEKVYQEFAKHYYDEINEVYGRDENDTNIFSIDLFHEGGSVPSGVDAKTAWGYCYNGLDSNTNNSSMIVQAWEWQDTQKLVMDVVPSDRLIVENMQSSISITDYDGKCKNVAAVDISNFGGRTGTFGRVEKYIENYVNYINSGKTNICSFGDIGEGMTNDFSSWNTSTLFCAASLELIHAKLKCDINNSNKTNLDLEETKKQVYSDMLELYKLFNSNLSDGTTKLDENLLKYDYINNSSSIQGPVEAIICTNPRLDATKVSSWSSAIPQNTITEALYTFVNDINTPSVWYSSSKGKLSMMKEQLVNALNIVSYKLLKKIKYEFETNGILKDWYTMKANFLSLIDDIESVQSIDSETDFSTLVNNCYNIVDSDYNSGLDSEQIKFEKLWLFRNNIKRLVTIWWDSKAADKGLANYAYREYAGLISEFYKPRWEKYFSTIEVDGINLANQINWTAYAEEFIEEKEWNYINSNTNLDNEQKFSVLYNIFNKYFTVKYDADGNISGVEVSVISEYESETTPTPVDSSDQETVSNYKQYINNISLSVSNATTKEVITSGEGVAAQDTVNWYSPIMLENSVSEKTNVKIDFSITSNGLNICCLFAYLVDKNTGKTIASSHYGTKKSSDNGFLNNYSDYITAAIDKDTDYTLYFRVESSWSDNINDDGTLKDHNAKITRPSIFIEIPKKETKQDDDAWDKDGTISNLYFKATGVRYYITKMKDNCLGDKDLLKRCYESLVWHIGRLRSCEDASEFSDTKHTGRRDQKGNDSYLVTKLKKLFEIV